MKKLSKQEGVVKQIIAYKDICYKSYDGRHIWAEGQLFKNPDIFSLSIPFIRIIHKRMDICRACGIVRRKD